MAEPRVHRPTAHAPQGEVPPAGGSGGGVGSARRLPLIAWDTLRFAAPAELGSLVGQWRGPTPIHPDWPGAFAIEAHELEVGS